MISKLLASDRLKLSFIIAVSCAVAYYLFSANLSAEFGIIDDHNIIFFLGPDGKLALSDIPRLFLASEGGRPFETHRYRPVAWLLFLAESYLWGDSVQLWYLARLGIFAASLAVYWRLFSKKIGIAPSFLFMMSLLSFSFWTRTFTRLLPSEIYALLAVAIFFLGFVRIVVTAERRPAQNGTNAADWTLVFIGAVVAIGVKENFLFLLLPTLILFIFAWRERLLNRLAVLYTALIFAFGALIAGSVVFVAMQTKIDYYNRSVEPAVLSKLLYPAFTALIFDNEVLFSFFAACALFLLYPILVYRGNGRDAEAVRERSLVVFLLSLLGAIFLYASQYVFYTGHWPLENRYDFPGVYAKPLIFFATVAFIVSISKTFRNGKYFKTISLVVFSALMALSVDFTGFSTMRKESAKNAAVTKDFNAKINLIAEKLRDESTSNLMLVINDPRYYEHVLSAPRFLRYHGVKNPLYLWVPDYSQEFVARTNSFGLVKRIRHASRMGTRDVSPDGYAFSFFDPKDAINPFEEFKANKEKCYAVSFLGPAIVPGCVDILKNG